ncbi:MAG: DUF6134 family protein [Gemmatimonadota bacterium]
MRRFLTSSAVSAVLLWGAQGASAQSVVLDQGSFRLAVDGRPAGTETFEISRAGSGPEAQVYARGEIDITMPEGRLDLRPLLQSGGTEMAVAAYQIKISGQQQQEIYVELGDRRYLTRILSERGEQQRESRAAPGTLVLDTGVAHQYYFLAARLRSGGGTVPVIVPREGRQFELQVTEVGQESLSIGGQTIAARHLRLTGNQETRELWVDAEGRVLRVDHPAQGYSATREMAP